jgi:hypothetical protein
MNKNKYPKKDRYLVRNEDNRQKVFDDKKDEEEKKNSLPTDAEYAQGGPINTD